jgi:hypothetical protein
VSAAPFSNGPVLALKGSEPFGVGGRRMCFAHPLEPDKCVKVLRTDEKRTIRIKSGSLIPAAWRREYNNNTHEMRELLALEKRIGTRNMGRHIPRCYGMAATDLGPGLVLDLVRDEDGRISHSIRELITIGYNLEKLRPAFDEFCRFLSDHLVLTRSILDHNLAVSMGAQGPLRIVMIDGLGYPGWLPVAAWVPAIGRAKVAQRKEEAWRRFETFAAKGGVSEELRRNSTWDQGLLRHRG